jgi:hypothetical protein
MRMLGGIFKRTTDIHIGGGNSRKKVEYLLWNKETGEEKSFQHGIDARECLANGAEFWSSSPIDGKFPTDHKDIHIEEELPEPIVLPDVDENFMVKGKETLVEETPIPAVSGLTRGRKKKVA